ncbi:hypothetical protein HDU79_005340 [Rhizoclosmatium sp. JEL0117]|nr:hypothetical protein HDU79_005340 [Rhizoclosmatium sp. JEL0117]
MHSKESLARLTKKDLAQIIKANNWDIDTALKKDVLIAAILAHQAPVEHTDTTEAVMELAEEKAPNLDSLSRPELVKLAKSLGVSATGKKHELVERIMEAQQQNVRRTDGDPPAVLDREAQVPKTYFCVIERAEFASEGKGYPGIAILKSGLVFLEDSESKKAHPLRLPIHHNNGALPDGYLDNIVCRPCLEKNRAMGIFFINKLCISEVKEIASASARPEPLLSKHDEALNDNNILDEISMISETANDVLAALDMCDEEPEFKGTPSSVTSDVGNTSFATSKEFLSLSASPSAIPISSKITALPSPRAAIPSSHRKPVKQSLHIELAQRRMSQKLHSSQASQAARDKKLAETRRLATHATETLDPPGDDISPDNSFSSTTTSGSGRSLKLPAPAKERKARGEVLWKPPTRPASALDTSSYVPKEDESIAKAVEDILGQTERGSEEEWKMITGMGQMGSKKVVRSP